MNSVHLSTYREACESLLEFYRKRPTHLFGVPLNVDESNFVVQVNTNDIAGIRPPKCDSFFSSISRLYIYDIDRLLVEMGVLTEDAFIAMQAQNPLSGPNVAMC